VLFPTVQFAAFFAVVFVVSWRLMPHQRAWRRFILAASYFFYGCADWRFVILLIASTLVNQVAATVGSRAPATAVRRAAVVSAVIFDLGILAVFKYFDFFIGTVNQLLGVVGLGAPLPLLQIALPVGVSFYTFQAISYVIDVYRGVCPLARPIDYGVYASFFPHLVAGPIVRPGEFIPQLARPRDPVRIHAARALSLVAGGLFKKVVLADLLASRIVDPVFGAPAAHSGPEVVAAIYGYAVQIYCDFSGYTDMAIGLALLLGFRFPANFDRPYAACSLQDFWRRWHMTLSRWLRDYLYIPLGGSRRGLRRTYLNLMLTMLLGGMWHGAAWTFVIWGGVHGGGLAVQRWWSDRRTCVPALADRAPGGRTAGSQTQTAQSPRDRPGSALRRAGCWLLTFQLVCLAWVFFRAPDLGTACTLLARLAAPGPAPLVTPGVIIMIVIGLATQLPRPGTWRQVRDRFVLLPPAVQGMALGAFLVATTAIADQQGVPPFIYFRF
jgi:alginate O-acetyltransferase complex protein AlgI